MDLTFFFNINFGYITGDQKNWSTIFSMSSGSLPAIQKFRMCPFSDPLIIYFIFIFDPPYLIRLQVYYWWSQNSLCAHCQIHWFFFQFSSTITNPRFLFFNLNFRFSISGPKNPHVPIFRSTDFFFNFRSTKMDPLILFFNINIRFFRNDPKTPMRPFSSPLTFFLGFLIHHI